MSFISMFRKLLCVFPFKCHDVTAQEDEITWPHRACHSVDQDMVLSRISHMFIDKNWTLWIIMSTVCCTDIALECIHPISVSSGEMTEWRFSSKALKSHRHLIMFYLVTHSFYFPSSLVRSIREVQIFFSFTHNYWMLLNNSLASSCCSVLQILAKSSRKKK